MTDAATEQRLGRLLGPDSGCGGIEVTSLFGPILEHVLDYGQGTIDEFIKSVRGRFLGNKEALLRSIYGEEPWRPLLIDGTTQLRALELLVRYDEDLWITGPKLTTDRPVTVVEADRKRGRKAITMAVHSKAMRDTLGEEFERRAEMKSMYAALTAGQSFDVLISSADGERRARLPVHPLARAIPQVGEQEFADLAEDVLAHGVRNSITLFEGQVLDGRHRVAIASALQVPVKVREFEGDEEAAKDEVVSQNLKRRHLTSAQRVLVVQELFLPQAEAEARGRLSEAGARGGRNGVPPKGDTPSARAPEKLYARTRAADVAAKRSGGLVSGVTMRKMAPVREAPRTQARIRSGEIKNTREARQEALKELGRDPNEHTPRAKEERNDWGVTWTGDPSEGPKRVLRKLKREPEFYSELRELIDADQAEDYLHSDD